MQNTVFHWGQLWIPSACTPNADRFLFLLTSGDVELLTAENALLQPHGPSPSLWGRQQSTSVLPGALRALPDPKRDLCPSGTVQWCQGCIRLQSLLQLLEHRVLWGLASARRSCAAMSVGAEQTPPRGPLGFYDKATVIHKYIFVLLLFLQHSYCPPLCHTALQVCFQKAAFLLLKALPVLSKISEPLTLQLAKFTTCLQYPA